MKKLLHVGCGPKTKEQTTEIFKLDDWEETRLDIDVNVKPDIVASLTDFSSIEDNTYDAIFSSHNIEHLFPHEVELAFKEFNRVLVDDGYLLITCPDLKNVSKYVAEDKLLEPLYESPAGPITPLDIMFGHRGSIQNGNTFMAHKCGFTMNVLVGLLNNCGFKSSVGAERANYFDIWAIGYKNIEILPEQSTKLLKEHLGIKEENIEFN